MVYDDYYHEITSNKFENAETIIGWSENNLMAYFNYYSPNEPVGVLRTIDIVDLKTGDLKISLDESYSFDSIVEVLIKYKIVLSKSVFTTLPCSFMDDTLNYRMDNNGTVELYLEKSKKNIVFTVLNDGEISRFIMDGFVINPFSNN